MKKWPKNWIEHVNETCSFYFEDLDISFVESKILYEVESKVCSARLTFQKYNKLYDIYISYENSYFVVNYYYKNYYMFRKRKKNEQDLVSFIETWIGGNDKTGLFNYFDLGGVSQKDSICSPYDISKDIESTINCHNDRGGGDDEGGENDPITPFSPCDTMKPELICS